MDHQTLKPSPSQSLKGILLSFVAGMLLHIAKVFSKQAIIFSPEVVTTFHIQTVRFGVLLFIGLFLPLCMDINYHNVQARNVLCLRTISGYLGSLAMFGAIQLIPFSQI